MPIGRSLAAVALLAAALGCPGIAKAEQVSPDLPIAEWTANPVCLQDMKGLVTVLIFFNDDCS